MTVSYPNLCYKGTAVYGFYRNDKNNPILV